jgi:hypothetical protein
VSVVAAWCGTLGVVVPAARNKKPVAVCCVCMMRVDTQTALRHLVRIRVVPCVC